MLKIWIIGREGGQVYGIPLIGSMLDDRTKIIGIPVESFKGGGYF